MKKNLKVITNIIIVLLSITFLLLAVLFFNNKEIFSIGKQRECLFEKQILEIVLKTNIRYEGVDLNDLSLLDKNNQSLYLSNILDTIPSLFLYVPLQGCDKCVQDILPLIKESIALNKNSINVYLLVKSPNFRSFIASQIDDKNNIESFYINEDWLGLDIEQFDTPFLFLADQTLRTDCFYVVDKNIPDINKYYLEKIFSNL